MPSAPMLAHRSGSHDVAAPIATVVAASMFTCLRRRRPLGGRFLRPDGPPRPDGGHGRLLTNAAIITALTVVNVIVGIGFQEVLAAHLGAGSTADVFAAGVSLPTLVATAVIGSVPLVLVPQIASYRARCDDRLPPLSALWVATAYTIATAVVIAGAAQLLSHLAAPGFRGAKEVATAHFIRLTSPVVLLSAVAAVGQAVAYANGRFLRAGAGSAVNGVGLLLVTVLFFGARPTASDLAIAVVIGYTAQAIWMLPELASSWKLWDRTPNARAAGMLKALGVLVTASLIYKGQPLIERTIASTLQPGSAAVMSYSLKIAAGLALLSVGVSQVAMPSFAHSLAQDDDGQAARTLQLVLTIVTATTAAVVAYVLLASADIVRVLFGRGSLGIHAEREIAAVVRSYLIFVLTNAIAGPIVNVHYALNRQRWVAVIGLVGMICATVLSVGLAQVFGVVGVAVGTGVGSLIPLAVFSVHLRPRLPAWSWRLWFRDNGRMFGTLLSGLALAGAGSLSLHLGLPPRGDYGRLMVVLGVKAGFLFLGLAVAAALFRWDPRTLVRPHRRPGVSS